MGIADLLDRPVSEETTDPGFSAEFPRNSGGLSADFRPADLTPDPAPGRSRKNAGKTGSKAAAAKARTDTITTSKPQAVAEIADELEMWFGVLSGTWAMRDPICAPVLNTQARAIAESTAILIGRSERLLAMAHGGGLLGDIGRSIMAWLPVLSVIRAHHITKSLAEEEPGGDALAGFPAFSPTSG